VILTRLCFPEDKIVLEVFLAETYGKLKYKGGAPEQQITQTDADEGKYM
jgi:hypothetical protein